MPSNVAQWQVSEFNSQKNQLQDTVVNRFINKLTGGGGGEEKNMSFVASILMPFEIVKIHSPSHQLKLKRTSCQAVVDASITKNSAQDQNLIIIIEIATIHMPRMLVKDHYDPVEKKTTRACMVAFYPEFELTNSTNKRQQAPLINLLLDCSNSMKENNLLGLSKALALGMLDHLPDECLFNVIMFGSYCVPLFPYEMKKTPGSVKKAKEFVVNVSNSKAKGNTDVLNVLREYLSLGGGGGEERAQNFVLISDGHFTRPNELFAALDQRNNNAANNLRVFTCSIGNQSNNNHFLKTLSRITNASYEEFSSSLKSKWVKKCVDLIDKCKQPTAISDIQIEWQNMKPESLQAPNKIG